MKASTSVHIGEVDVLTISHVHERRPVQILLSDSHALPRPLLALVLPLECVSEEDKNA